MTYGNVPQNRERIYVVAFLNEDDYMRFNFPDPIPLTNTIADVVDMVNRVPDKYYYTKEKYPRIFETVENTELKNNTIYQWRRVYLRENKSNVCPTLTANMGTGGHNVPLVKTQYGLRKLTPKECFIFQGFPADFVLPDTVSDTLLYKQAGNSVVVPVIHMIAENIADACGL
jgi:DNA (cytosine-5)-methyltransferase 1